jgi:hypothetical protein
LGRKMADTRELQAELSAIAAKQAEINGKLRDMQLNRQKRFETGDRGARGPRDGFSRDERAGDLWRASGGGTFLGVLAGSMHCCHVVVMVCLDGIMCSRAVTASP